MFGLFKKKKLSRKEQSEKLLEKKGIKINYNLPHIESEEETTVRTPNEIAERAIVLAILNFVAFNSLTGEEASKYLNKYNLYQFVTPDEHDFLQNPTEEKKNKESWKCEGIWTLLWALKIVDDLGDPDEMCNLNDVPADKYPINQDRDPNLFIRNNLQSRTKSEILDANDLYYRMNWACVDARINGREVEYLNTGVVYERQYALNWLINYMDQDWDDISCDT
ncbi:MAG: DUF4272 domain-containing protein [Bacteroidetes bacterium HGW-Bacteroidetes-23]|nr:MAG: DUF4272 domain-containing protein [Bacteroidetes bacterium HGW-Bacteroidetes-23]